MLAPLSDSLQVPGSHGCDTIFCNGLPAWPANRFSRRKAVCRTTPEGQRSAPHDNLVWQVRHHNRARGELSHSPPGTPCRCTTFEDEAQVKSGLSPQVWPFLLNHLDSWLTGEWEWSGTTEKWHYFVKRGNGLPMLTGFTLLWELIFQEK